MALTGAEQSLMRDIAERARDLLDDLRLHVAIPTGLNHTPGLDETRERLTARLRALGAEVEIVPGTPSPEWLHARGADAAPYHIPPTAVARRLAPGDRNVLLAGHLDTVHDPRSSFRALAVSPDQKTATGPGCVDMKGGLVIAVAALEAIAQCDACPTLGWSFLLNSDEETGSFHSAHAIAGEAASGRYAAGIALEPAMTDGGLVVQRGGSGQFMLEAHGRAAHVGRDFHHGVSAVYALAQAITEAGHISHNGIVVNVGPLQGGATTNTVPDFARAWGNVRFPDEAGAGELHRRLEALGTGHEGPTLPRVLVRQAFNRPAKPLTPGTDRLARLARTCAEDLGQQLPFGSTGGVCDGNNMQAAGLATIDTLGVRGGGLHTPQEWIEIPSLVERCQLLVLTLVRLA
jgi:glutamate carboxypeptidase